MDPDQDDAALRRRNAEAQRRWKARHPEASARDLRLRGLCRRLTRASLRLRGEHDHRPAESRGRDDR